LSYELTGFEINAASWAKEMGHPSTCCANVMHALHERYIFLIFAPYVEAFYPQPVPCKAFTGYLIICGVYETIYEYIPHGGAFPEIFRKVDDFLIKYKEIYMDPLNKLEKELEK
jgi:hypothetical protein